MDHGTVWLASASPRRRELLSQIGVAHEVCPVDIDESRLPGEAPRDFVRRLAVEKATRAWRDNAAAGGQPVLAADTVVVLGDVVFGKPADPADAVDILGRLSGRTHDVLTAVACMQEGERDVRLSASQVSFRPISPAEREAYVATGEPMDKAGAYAIQGRAAVFVERLEGSYSGVMGLPLFETAALLHAFGLPSFAPEPALP